MTGWPATCRLISPSDSSCFPRVARPPPATSLEEQRLTQEQEDHEKEGMRRKLLRPVLNHFQSRSLARRLGGGEAGAKLAECILEVLTDDFDDPPATAKTGPDKPGKSLQTNDVEEFQSSEAVPHQSQSVKPSQTDFMPPSAPGAVPSVLSIYQTPEWPKT